MFHSEEVPAAPKRIIICCDGTWQSSVSDKRNTPSNVTRLCRHLARAGKDASGKIWQQIVYYDAGIGTAALTGVSSQIEGYLGLGLDRNVLEAYSFIVNNYSPGDELFCFGFSRGAFTARAVAGLVTDIGLCEPRDLIVMPEVYSIYKQNKDGHNFRESQLWKDFVDGKLVDDKWVIKPHGELAIDDNTRKIKVIGVWDTVGALGIPDIAGHDMSAWRKDYGFHNVSLSKYVENAFQALGLDERRKPYTPAVWYTKWDTNLLQCWFPGVHVNIGGGSTDTLNAKKGDLENIANITFAWMIEQVRPFLAFEEVTFYQAMREHELLLEEIAKEEVPEGWIEWIAHKATGTKPEPRKVNRGWATGPILNSYAGIAKITGEFVRVPKKITDDKNRLVSSLGATSEVIHPCVAYRMEKSTYRPDGLKDYTRRLNGKRYEWVSGDLVLPEHVIQKDNVNLERMAADYDATEWLAKIDAL